MDILLSVRKVLADDRPNRLSSLFVFGIAAVFGIASPSSLTISNYPHQLNSASSERYVGHLANETVDQRVDTDKRNRRHRQRFPRMCKRQPDSRLRADCKVGSD